MNLHDVMMMGGKLRHKELGIRNKKAVRSKSGVILRISLFTNLLCRHLFLLLEKHHNVSLVFFVLGCWRYGEDFPPKIILWSFRLCIHCVTTIAAASTNYQTIFLQIEKNSFITNLLYPTAIQVILGVGDLEPLEIQKYCGTVQNTHFWMRKLKKTIWLSKQSSIKLTFPFKLFFACLMNVLSSLYLALQIYIVR